MTKQITFSAFGRDSYYHREWFKKNGFKFDRSSRRWVVEKLPNWKPIRPRRIRKKSK